MSIDCRQGRSHWFAFAVFVLLLPACGDSPTTRAEEALPGLSLTEDRTLVKAATELPGEKSAPAFEGIASDIYDQLAAIPGMQVAEIASPPRGYRGFLLTFEQPVDAIGAESPGLFRQRLALLHRDPEAPMVFRPGGYYLPSLDSVSEPTRLLGGNQLSVEHRFFIPSRPEPADWRYLSIEQAAADHHRIVEALKPLYRGAWVSTGGSKGGMTAVYHRRFFPSDVDATIAYVAPLSYGKGDRRYVRFLDKLGDRACRERLRDFQRDILERRSRLAPLLTDWARSFGTGFERLPGGVDQAIEAAASDFLFAFWQYGGASFCPLIPGRDAADSKMLEFLHAFGVTFFSTDWGIEAFAPYTYQAMHQLGYPAPSTRHLRDLLIYDASDLRPYLPIGVEPPQFDPWAMPDIALWTVREGERLLFLYGGDDPWTAGAFAVLPHGIRETYKFVVPGGNHGANIRDLPEGERARVLAILADWTGVTPALTSTGEQGSAHEESQLAELPDTALAHYWELMDPRLFRLLHPPPDDLGLLRFRL